MRFLDNNVLRTSCEGAYGPSADPRQLVIIKQSARDNLYVRSRGTLLSFSSFSSSLALDSCY